MSEHMRNVYGPAFPYDGMPEGTTVGANEQFVAFSIGFREECLLLPEEVETFIELLQRAQTEQRSLRVPTTTFVTVKLQAMNPQGNS